MLRTVSLVTPPAAEPITLEEARLHLRVTGTEEDSLITSLVTASRRAAEGKTNRALMLQTWRLSLDRFPYPDNAPILLPRPPFGSVTAFTYTDATGAGQTLTTGATTLVDRGVCAELVPAYGTVWPVAREHPGSVQITYTAGYASAADVPAEIKAWMKIHLATLYENRDLVLRGLEASASFLPGRFVDGLLDPYIVPFTS